MDKDNVEQMKQSEYPVTKLLVSIFSKDNSINSEFIPILSSYDRIPNIRKTVLTMNSDGNDIMHDHNSIFTIFVNNGFDYILFLNDTLLYDEELLDMFNHKVDLISNFTDFAVEEFSPDDINLDKTLFEIDKIYFRSTLMSKRLGSLLVQHAEKNKLYYSCNPKHTGGSKIPERDKIYNLFHTSAVDNIYRSGFVNMYNTLDNLGIKSHINISRKLRGLT